ncbi:hypothetical protein PR202_gb12566 [Eleusine coracana subsp. coracana]|uniref:Uncharacterized protein n=1 Tax=Eleusine coracana subsp. coracana TaxID=191504 RepID=A0AAV5EQD3_ELECO|nr:hypothetical protein PR202_gb12566 [Eleusine coracana subsp. coracana]
MTSKSTDRGADACLGRLVHQLKTKAAAAQKEKERKEAEERESAAANVVGSWLLCLQSHRTSPMGEGWLIPNDPDNDDDSKVKAAKVSDVDAKTYGNVRTLLDGTVFRLHKGGHVRGCDDGVDYLSDYGDTDDDDMDDEFDDDDDEDDC